MPPDNRDYLHIGRNAPQLNELNMPRDLEGSLGRISAQTGRDVTGAYRNVTEAVNTLQPHIETLEIIKSRYVKLMETNAEELSDLDESQLEQIALEIEREQSLTGDDITLSRTAEDLKSEIAELLEKEQNTLQQVREQVIEGREEVKSLIAENPAFEDLLRQHQENAGREQIRQEVASSDPQDLLNEIINSNRPQPQFISDLMNLNPDQRNNQLVNFVSNRRIQEYEGAQEEIGREVNNSQVAQQLLRGMPVEQFQSEVQGMVEQGRFTPEEARPVLEGEQDREEFLGRFGPDIATGHINSQGEARRNPPEPIVTGGGDVPPTDPPERSTTEDEPPRPENFSIRANDTNLTEFSMPPQIENMLQDLSSNRGEDVSGAYQEFMQTIDNLRPQIGMLREVRERYKSLVEANRQDFESIDQEELNQIAADIEREQRDAGNNVNLSRTSNLLAKEIEDLYKAEQGNLEKVRNNVITGREKVKTLMQDNEGFGEIATEHQDIARETHIRERVGLMSAHQLSEEFPNRGLSDRGISGLVNRMTYSKEDRRAHEDEYRERLINQRLEEDRTARIEEDEEIASSISKQANNATMDEDALREDIRSRTTAGDFTADETSAFTSGRQSREEFLNRFGPDLSTGDDGTQTINNQTFDTGGIPPEPPRRGGGFGAQDDTPFGDRPTDVRVVNTEQDPVNIKGGGTGGGAVAGGGAVTQRMPLHQQDRAEEFLREQEINRIISGVSDVATPGGPALMGTAMSTATGVLSSAAFTGWAKRGARKHFGDRQQQQQEEPVQSEGGHFGAAGLGGAARVGWGAAGRLGAGAAGGAAAAGAGGAAAGTAGAGAATAGLGAAGLAAFGATAIPLAGAAAGKAWWETAQHQRNLERTFGTEQGIGPGAMLNSPILQEQVSARIQNPFLGGEEIQQLTEAMAEMGSTAEQTAEALGPASDALSRYRILTPELAAGSAREGQVFGSPIGGQESKVLGRLMQSIAGQGFSSQHLQQVAEQGQKQFGQMGLPGGAQAGTAAAAAYSSSRNPRVDQILQNNNAAGSAVEYGTAAYADPMGEAGMLAGIGSGVNVASINPTTPEGRSQLTLLQERTIARKTNTEGYVRNAEGEIDFENEDNRRRASIEARTLQTWNVNVTPDELMARAQNREEANKRLNAEAEERGTGETFTDIEGLERETQRSDRRAGTYRDIQQRGVTGETREAVIAGEQEAIDPDSIRTDIEGNELTEDDPTTENVDETPQEVSAWQKTKNFAARTFADETGIDVFAPESGENMAAGLEGSGDTTLMEEGGVFAALESGGAESEDIDVVGGGSLKEAIDAGTATGATEIKVGEEVLTVDEAAQQMGDNRLAFDNSFMGDIPGLGSLFGGDELQFTAGENGTAGQMIGLTPEASEYFELKGPGNASDPATISGNVSQSQESIAAGKGGKEVSDIGENRRVSGQR